MLKVDENKLILSKNLLSLLDASPGDKITINYLVEDGIISPIILKSDAGNVLTKSNTVSFKGKQREYLLQFGSRFDVSPYKVGEAFRLVNEQGVYISVVSQPKIKEETLDKSIILDTNYDIQKFQKYEL